MAGIRPGGGETPEAGERPLVLTGARDTGHPTARIGRLSLRASDRVYFHLQSVSEYFCSGRVDVGSILLERAPRIKRNSIALRAPIFHDQWPGCVLEGTTTAAGPWCAAMLSDLGPDQGRKSFRNHLSQQKLRALVTPYIHPPHSPSLHDSGSLPGNRSGS